MLNEGALRSLTAVRTVSLDFNPADFLSQDSWTETVQTKPLSVGRVIEYHVDFAEVAQLVGTVDGRNIYRLEIELEGEPVGCNLYYEDFYIPEDGKLYIYSPEGKQVLGAYTHATHPKHGAFATEPISGNKLILEYEAPTTGEMPSVKVQGAGYLYRPVLMATIDRGAKEHRGLEDRSDPGFGQYCLVNVNCPEGDPYQALKSSSVAMLMTSKTGGLGLCSGNLVNNLAGDFKPYIMTAAHCSSRAEVFEPSSLELSQWIFSFHYEKPRCSSGDYATMQEVSMVGAEMKSFLPITGYSDGLLLLLKNEIPLEYRVYYSGWDASSEVWPRGAGIHHPAGDATKISLFDGDVKIVRWNGDEGGEDDHFGFKFKKGNTEEGSSGSPLFNSDGDQIGTLTGGNISICSMDAVYGRLNSHFEKYKDKGETWYMSKWLDPNNTGRKQVKGTWRENYQPLAVVPSITATIDPKDITKVKVLWKPVPQHPQGYAVKYTLYRNGNRVASTEETTYEDQLSDNVRSKGRVSYSVEAVYTVQDDKEIATPRANYTLYTGRLASRAPLKVSAGETGAKLKWQMPYNAQVVTKIKDRDDVLPILVSSGVDGIINRYLPKKNVYRIYMYDSYRLGQSPLNGRKLYIHQINFIPSQDTQYTSDGSIDAEKNISFFVRQKINGRPVQYYDLDVPKGTAAKKQFFSQQLSTPLEISDAHLLDVGFAFDASNTKGSIYVDGNSSDEKIAYDGCKLALDYARPGNGFTYPRKFFVWNTPYSKDYMAYQAVELVISDNPQKQPGVTNEYYTRGELPVPFPEIKNYVVYRNGKQIKTLSAKDFVYEDETGKTTDDYYVEVVYDYPAELRPNEPVGRVTSEVNIYPAHFTTQLQLTDATDVRSVELYSMEGIQVASFTGAQLMAMDVASLPAGQYIATIRTSDGVQTQRLVK